MSIGHPPLTGESTVPSPEQIGLIRLHLKQVLASHAFAGSKRTQDFLELIVTHALEGEFDQLRERMIGAEMFGRPVGYDTGSDSVVRVKATDVRKKLAQFYAETREPLAVRIELPSGSYVPRFHFEPQPDPPAIAIPAGKPARPRRPAESVPADPAHPPPAHAAPASAPRRSPWLAPALVLAILILAAAGYAGYRWHSASLARSDIRSIAILPLNNLSGDPAQEYFADGMTEELINDLGQVSTLRVISLTSSMSYKGTKKKLPEIARELAVDAVVEGGVHRPPHLGPHLRAGLLQRPGLAGRSGPGHRQRDQHQRHPAGAGAPGPQSPHRSRGPGLFPARPAAAGRRRLQRRRGLLQQGHR
jgi:hypothetical protein